MSTIALLTDFGASDWFVGTMKGVILAIAPKASIADITHQILPGSIRSGAFALKQSYRYFPKGTVFLTVVDPSVGSERLAIAVKTKNYMFVAPDNGLLSFALEQESNVQIRKIANKKLLLSHTSNTFHGRDIFAPAAAHLARGAAYSSIGPLYTDMVKLPWPQVKKSQSRMTGEVVYIDKFGNLITNIAEADIYGFALQKIKIGMGKTRIPYCTNYCQVPEGKALAILGSCNLLEVSVNRGDAAHRFKAKIGDKVTAYVA